jgi:2-aminoadipate transaminase
MNWNPLFAKRTALMKRTAVRQLLRVAAQPGVISFAGGLPPEELFPVERVNAAVTEVLREVGGRSLQYIETEGLPGLREWIAAEFTRQARELARKTNGGGALSIAPENVLITSGAQQALDLIGRVLLEDGDRVVVENPTYLALLSAWRPQGVQFLAARSDDNGMCLETLEPLLRQHPKLIYVTPNFQNPQGTTLPLERRHELLKMAADNGVGIVEDNPYGDLRYSDEAVPHLMLLEHFSEAEARGTQRSRKVIEPQSVIYTGTFSKVLMPGLRVGWVIAHRDLIEKMVQAKQACDLHTNTLGQHIVLKLLRQGFLAEFVPRLQSEYRRRRDAMLEALSRYFPAEATWTRPAGGMFLMARVPSIDASNLLPEALNRGVAYVPGEEFHLDGAGHDTLRLNFTNASPERIQEGIRRLGQLYIFSASSRCLSTTGP